VECAPAGAIDPHQRARHRAGLSPDSSAQLFQPFNRLGKEAAREEGTGIGLVVTKRLVELMGGRSASTARRRGQRVLDRIDLTAAPRRRRRTAEVRVRAAGARRPPPRTLLYVEDNPPTSNWSSSSSRAARPAPAERGGRHARHRVRARLPAGGDPDGHQPAGHQRHRGDEDPARDPSTAHIPIIALSANAVPRDIETGLEAGFFNYLTKPIKVDQFMEALDLALEIRATPGRAEGSCMNAPSRDPQRAS
jgi:hypothetical protein